MPHSTKPLHIAVFLPSPPRSDGSGGTQLLDLACVDLLAMTSRQYLSQLGPSLASPHLLALAAPSVTVSYVGVQSSPTTAALTAGLTISTTHHFSDVAVAAPDIVLVPGPSPDETWDPAALAWLAACAETADVLSVCTGLFVCGEAGLLAGGRRACGPRGLQGDLRRRFEGVRLVGDKLRWVRDGNFWSSGGVTNGNDMVAAYMRTSGRFAAPLVEIVLAMAEVGDRPQKYGQSQTMFTLGIVWQMLKAWFVGGGGGANGKTKAV